MTTFKSSPTTSVSTPKKRDSKPWPNSSRDRRAPLSLRTKARAISGFSLVEMTIALGIITFGLVSVVGLLPVGLSNMREATDDTTEGLIANRIAYEVRMTSFSALDAKYQAKRFFYDDEGQEQAHEAAFTRYRVTTEIRQIDYPGVLKAPPEAPLANNVKVVNITLTTSASASAIPRATNQFSVPISEGN